MTNNDITQLVSFINDHIEKMGRAGCNDYFLENTPENRKLAIAAGLQYIEDGDEARPVRIIDGKIVTTDFVILIELKRRLLADVRRCCECGSVS